MDVIDNVTLALLARQEPKRVLYARQPHNEKGRWWAQHASRRATCTRTRSSCRTG